VGGPIIKDRTFFFFNHEFQRFRTTLTNHGNVPTQQFQKGQFLWHTLDLSDPQNPVPVEVNVDLTQSSSQNLKACR